MSASACPFSRAGSRFLSSFIDYTINGLVIGNIYALLAVGLALINTLLDKRMDLHLEMLRESVTWGRQVATDTLASMTAALAARGSDAELAATRQLALIVRKQAEVMAISDVFLALTVVFLGCVSLAALMRRPAPAGAGGGGGH